MPPASEPATLAFPVTLRLPVRFRENALMAPVLETLEKFGAVGSLGRMTFGICRVVMPGPEISISYLPGAA